MQTRQGFFLQGKIFRCMVLGKNNFTRRGVKATKPISFLYEFLNLRLDVNYLDPMNNPENDVPSYLFKTFHCIQNFRQNKHGSRCSSRAMFHLLDTKYCCKNT